MAKRRVSGDTLVRVVDLYLAGVPLRKIADESETSVGTVNRIINDFGARTPGVNSSKLTIPESEFLRLADSGMTLREIGKALGCSTASVFRAISRNPSHPTRWKAVLRNTASLYRKKPTK